MHEWKLIYIAKDAKMNPYKWGCVKCKSTLWTDIVQRPPGDVKSGGLTCNEMVVAAVLAE